GGDHWVRIGDVVKGQETDALPEHKGQVYTASYSPDGRYLATAGADRVVRIWDVDAGTSRLVRPLKGHNEEIWCVAFSPDSRYLASADGTGVVKLWDTANWRLVHTIPGYGQVAWCAVFSPDSQRLAIGYGGGTIRVWDVEGGLPKNPRDWKAHDDSIYRLA